MELKVGNNTRVDYTLPVRGIRSMELKVFSISIALCLTPSLESVQWNWKSPGETLASPRTAPWIRSMELKDVPLLAQSWDPRREESVQWNWKKVYASQNAEEEQERESVQWNWKQLWLKSTGINALYRIRSMELKGHNVRCVYTNRVSHGIRSMELKA